MTIEPVDELAARLNELRPTATVAVSQRAATNDREALDLLVAELSFQAIGEGWRELSKVEATALLTRVLGMNLAYNVSEMEPEQAAGFAREYLELAGTAKYFTNGTFSDTGWGGHKVAPGTFDTGVAWVSANCVGVLWVEDED